MDTKPHKTIKQLVAITLFSIVGFITINNIVFIHVHHLKTGEVVMHAHPFSNPGNNIPEQLNPLPTVH